MRTCTTLLALTLLGGLRAEEPKPRAIQGVDPAYIQTSTSPCRDFYGYANGAFDKVPIPGEYAGYGVNQEIDERNEAILKGILEGAMRSGGPKGSLAQRVGDFYASGMDEALIEKEGLKPLAPLVTAIQALRTPRELVTELGHLQVLGVRAGFRFSIQVDDKDSSSMVASFGQGGLGLPERDYYFRPGLEAEAIRQAYQQHLERMFLLAGDETKAAKAAAAAVLRLETKLAQASKTLVDLRDPQANYHKVSRKELSALAPGLDWEAFFSATGFPASETHVLVGQPDFFKDLAGLLASEPMDTWRTYLRWQVLRSAASYLGSAFVNENFAFYGKTLSGTTELRPDWMVAATKTQALKKLDTMNTKVGYPDRWRDYSGLDLSRRAFVLNVQAAQAFDFRRDLAKLGKPVDRNEWLMTPQTNNAYYEPTLNEMCFPAGILQPPFFDEKADDASNYGALASTIDHELTHGFDDQGRQYDWQGNLKDWWTAEDAKRFEARADHIVKQYDAFEVLPGLHINGKQTLGENIADIGGLRVSYEAFKLATQGREQKTVDGLSPDQRFFIAFAQGWRTNQRPEAIRLGVTTDVHSPIRWRVLGPVADFPEFRKAFGCEMTAQAPTAIW